LFAARPELACPPPPLQRVAEPPSVAHAVIGARPCAVHPGRRICLAAAAGWPRKDGIVGGL